MSCKICGRSACAAFMHSAKEQEDWESVDKLSDRQLKTEVLDLRKEVVDLKAEIENLKDEIKEIDQRVYDRS